jgi:hypothetical protein
MGGSVKAIYVAVLVLVASVASAQTIHQYPYDPAVTAYGTTVVKPTISGQCHLWPGNANTDGLTVPQLMALPIAHTHVDVTGPVYAELSHSVTVDFMLTLFHVDGVVSIGMVGQLLDPAVWDTPDGHQPSLVGDPNGIVTATGHVTINFAKADHSQMTAFDIPKKGWFEVEFIARTEYTSGNRTDTHLQLPFYSVIDPTAPEEQLTGQHGPEMGAYCNPTLPGDPVIQPLGLWEAAIYHDYLPILSPLTVAVTRPMPILGGYVVSGLPSGTGQTRFDMDLHHGHGGTLIESQMEPGSGGVVLQAPFDPAVLGPGPHKVAAGWSQDTDGGAPGIARANEQAVSWLVVPVTVGGIVPPPPPPVEVWSNWLLQHGSLSGNLRACPDASGVGCVGVMKN